MQLKYLPKYSKCHTYNMTLSPEYRIVSYVSWFKDICCECLVVVGTHFISFLVWHMSG